MPAKSVKIKKILLAMDGSESSIRASKYAIHLAKLEGAEITLVHVLENIRQGGALGLQAKYGNIRLVRGFIKASEDAARKWAEKVEKDAKRNGAKLTTEILLDQSSKAEEILKYAEKNKMDVIVVGTRGLTRFKRLIMGSVANAVIGNAKCTVVVVK